MRTRSRAGVAALAAALLFPALFSAFPQFSQGAVTARQVSARQVVSVSRRELNRHQQQERRQLNIYFRRLSALLRAHQLVERRLQRASQFQVPPPVAPIPTPFPF